MSDDKDRPDDDPMNNMFGMFFSGGQGPFSMDPGQLGSMMSRFQSMMTPPDPEDAALQTAESAVPQPDPTVTSETSQAAADAFRLAELWLSKVTDASSEAASVEALSRRGWVKETIGGWLSLASPIQERTASGLTESISEQIPEEMRGFLSSAQPMLASMTTSMFASQLGQAAAALSGSVLTGTEYGLPLAASGRPSMVSANITGFAAEIDVDVNELRIYLATLELAHYALFARAAWLRKHIEDAVRAYAATVEVNGSALGGIAPDMDPQKMQEAAEQMQKELFKPADTAERRAAEQNLQRLLSTVAGWTDVVAYAAVEPLEKRDQIRKALRERYSAQSEAEAEFASLIGLNIHPTRLNDAVQLFTFLEQTEGAEARDAVFNQAESLPSAVDLDDPLGYLERRSPETGDADIDNMDEALQRLLDEESGKND